MIGSSPSSTPRPRVTVIILCKNEEADLPNCLDSLKGLTDSVVVVDSGSTDGTVAIARKWGAEVLCREFDTHARQFNWALDTARTIGDWVLKMDADERLRTEADRKSG